jgi:hypothetical protein
MAHVYDRANCVLPADSLLIPKKADSLFGHDLFHFPRADILSLPGKKRAVSRVKMGWKLTDKVSLITLLFQVTLTAILQNLSDG